MENTNRKLVRAAFFAGVMTSLGVIVAAQDYLGLEAYIEYVRGHWIELPTIVGLLIAGVGVGFLLLIDRLARSLTEEP